MHEILWAINNTSYIINTLIVEEKYSLRWCAHAERRDDACWVDGSIKQDEEMISAEWCHGQAEYETSDLPVGARERREYTRVYTEQMNAET